MSDEGKVHNSKHTKTHQNLHSALKRNENTKKNRISFMNKGTLFWQITLISRLTCLVFFISIFSLIKRRWFCFEWTNNRKLPIYHPQNIYIVKNNIKTKREMTRKTHLAFVNVKSIFIYWEASSHQSIYFL